jgi:hypothetical protein
MRLHRRNLNASKWVGTICGMSSGQRILNFLRKPTLWLGVGFALVGFEGFSRIFAILAPPFVFWAISHVSGSSFLSGYTEAFQLYAQQVAPLIGYTVLGIYSSFAISLIYSVMLLVLLVLLIKRRSFARQSIIFLNSLGAVWALSVGLWNSRNAGAPGLITQFESLLFNGFILLIFTRPAIQKLFVGQQTDRTPEVFAAGP